METTLHFAQNADAGTEESYLRNLPLLKLLAKENIEADDWSVLLAATPNNEDKLLWCLGYTGNCGLPCANGNNSPANSNWNGVPRHADDKIALKRA